MKIKEGVVLAGLKIQMRKVLIEADKIWRTHGQELTITSGLEGNHSPSSLHYYGFALDLRSRYFSDSEADNVCYELRRSLGQQYNVIKEPDHIHVSFRFPFQE